jgi:histidyl-tRNA synthetase
VKIQAPPGMRDFYPEDMRLQNWLFDHWRSISRNFGFQEFEGPIFEYLDLYRVKSGGALVGELFHFTDRGQREFAIRPEMTPTLARMVAARANALPRPIKWFSLPRMCRAETPQRGRLREFFQWNVDILGVDDSLADAEVIAVAVEFFRAVGLGDEIVIRLNHRGLAAAALRSLGLPGESTAEAFSLIDRIERLPPAEFDAQWTAGFGAVVEVGKLREFLSQATLESCVQAATSADEQGAACAENFASLWRQLAALGVAQACQFDLRIVRGLAYYTGSVFEAHARKGGLRALLGAGDRLWHGRRPGARMPA